MEKQGAYAEVNKKWKATCKVVLGGEVGELKDYEAWLSDINTPRAVQKDAAGRDVVVAAPHYSKHARYISFEDVDFGKK